MISTMKQTHLLWVLTIFVTIQICSSSRSQGIFELHLKSFENKPGKDSAGQCCDGFKTSTGVCSGFCATRFRVCLKHYQATIDPKHECTFGERFTPVLANNTIQSMPKQIIEFPIDFKWPGTFSLIIEAWHENNKTSDGNALISRMATQQQLDAGKDWTQGVHQESHTKLEYEYRMVCSAHYYGKDCDTLCRPRDDQFGHYTCGFNGEKVCLDGYQKDPSNPEGDYCTKAICLEGCNTQHGSCDAPGECKCGSGWTGPLCDQCVRYPGCQHGSCKEPWQCNCNDGWGGLFCNQDLNYCTNNKPCRNGATCFNTGQGSYTCSCSPGYTGTNCETRITNECSHQPCLNGGTCQGTGVSNYTCVCPLGFHGNHCEMRAQTCEDRPCKNGAQCMDNPRGSAKYACKCPQGFQGVNCDVKVDPCRTSPCSNGATCSLTEDGTDYVCRCPVGFSGKNCDNNIDDCEINPCQNGGTCIDFVADYKCYCRPGFIGTHCEENINDCSGNPCQNGGSCYDSINDFVCACKPGFTGKDCSVEINECHSSPCMNNGFCVDRENDFECRCLPGYSGQACQILPDGTVMKMHQEEDMDGSRVALIATFSTVIPVLVIIAAVVLMCNKHRQRLDQVRANADAKRENELNAVHCASKTKMLDDHMIVNPLDYPKQKCINATNPNIADEELFSAKDGSVYKQMVSGGARSKQINTNNVQRASSGYMLSERLEKDIDSGRGSLNHSRLSNLPSSRGAYNCASSTSGASDCSSDSNLSSSQSHRPKMYNKSKDHSLPTAASIAASASAAASSRKSTFGSAASGSTSPSLHMRDIDHFATEV